MKKYHSEASPDLLRLKLDRVLVLHSVKSAGGGLYTVLKSSGVGKLCSKMAESFILLRPAALLGLKAILEWHLSPWENFSNRQH